MGAQLPLDSGKLEPHRHHPNCLRPMVLPASATACKTADNSDLIFLPDSLYKRVFLANSGASLSIGPYESQADPFGSTLRSTSGASISAWGYKTLQVKFSKTRLNHRFLLADVANQILGKFNLLISPPTHQVLFASSLYNILQTGTPQGPPQPALQQLRLVLHRDPPLASQTAAQQVDSTTLLSQV